jgi:hypothetical protein
MAVDAQDGKEAIMSARVPTPTLNPTIDTVALLRGAWYDITAFATCDTTSASRLALIGASRIARLYHISPVWLRRIFLAKKHKQSPSRCHGEFTFPMQSCRIEAMSLELPSSDQTLR